MSEKPENHDGLDSFFEAARQHPPEPSVELMARIAADAQTTLAPQMTRAGPAPWAGLLAELRRALGGWPGVAGLAAATCAGVWLGASPSLDLGTMLYGSDLTGLTLDAASGFDFVLVEG